MRRIILPIVLSFTLVAGAAASLHWFQPRGAKAQSGCALSTLQGSFGVRGEGWVNAGGSSGQVALTQVGFAAIDGAGNMSLAVTTSAGGQFSRQSFSYKVQVNSDCTGSVTPVPGSDGGPADFVVVAGGNQLLYVVTGQGLTLSGIFIRQ